MKFSKARIILLCIFLLFLILQMIFIMGTFIKKEISSADALNAIIKIVGIYSVPFAIILVGIFSQKNLSEKQTPKHVFWIALSLAIIWNVILAFRSTIFFLAPEDDINELLTHLNRLGGQTTSWLIAGAFSYFFAKR